MRNQDDDVMRAIKRRGDLEPVRISIRKLLAHDDMEQYLTVATNRICAAELIDGDSVEINFTDFQDLLINSDGFLSCRGILMGYIAEDNLADVFAELCIAERYRREVNSLAASFRKMKLSQLWAVYRKSGGTDNQEAARGLRAWLLAEVWNRSFVVGIWRKMKEAMTRVYLHMKYHRIFELFSTLATEKSAS